MDPVITEFAQQIQVAYEQAGWLATLATTIMFSVRLYRIELIQKLLPSDAKWENWPRWKKWLFPFLAAFIGMFILKMLSGIGWVAAITGAVTVALSSILGHKVTKAIGSIEGAHKAKKSPTYRPSKFRKAASIVVPVSKMFKLHGKPPAEKEPF